MIFDKLIGANNIFLYPAPWMLKRRYEFLPWKIKALNQSLITLAEGPNDVKLSYTYYDQFWICQTLLDPPYYNSVA